MTKLGHFALALFLAVASCTATPVYAQVQPGFPLANQVYAGPTSGGAAQPAFRLLVPTDLGILTTANTWTQTQTFTDSASPPAVDINMNANVASTFPLGAGWVARIASADGAAAIFGIDGYAASSGMQFRRADGTALSKSGVLNTDQIGSITFTGYTSAPGYSANNAVAIQVLATESWTGSANGALFRIRIAKNGTGAPADSLVVDGNQHFQLGSIAPFTLSSCGTGTITSGSTDSAGQVTATGSTTCTVTFGSSYAAAPSCVVSDNTRAAALQVQVNNGNGFVVSGLTAGDVFSWICIGKVGL